jgi:hypothetical protein
MTPPDEIEIRVDVVGTVVFVAMTVAAVFGSDGVRVAFAVVSAVLFFLGTALTGVAILKAIGRSRTEAISVADLFLVSAAPRATRVWLHGLLGLQVVVSIVGASIRPFTALAFGVLVPMFGLGVNGWWSASRGRFPPRDEQSAGPTGGHPG